jgi:hypothetical protein
MHGRKRVVRTPRQVSDAGFISTQLRAWRRIMPNNQKVDAVQLLKKDHTEVKELFEKFEKATDEWKKEEIADQVDLELRVHSMIEEEILYPALRDLTPDIVAESFEEHGVVEELLNELATMQLGDDQFEAKFKVMMENVEHHIEEEEKEMFPKAKQVPNYDQIGTKMAERKEQLKEQLSMAGDSSERATTEGEPATMKASEKAEAVLEGAKKPETPTPPRSASGGGRRSKRATAAAGRRSR